MLLPFFDVAAAAHLEPPSELSQVPIDLLARDFQPQLLFQPTLGIAGRPPLPLGQLRPEEFPLFRVEARLLATLGPVGVAEEFLQASVAEPADPWAEGSGRAAHNLGDAAVSLLAFQGQANGLEALALPRGAFPPLLLKDLLGLAVAVDRVADSEPA